MIKGINFNLIKIHNHRIKIELVDDPTVHSKGYDPDKYTLCGLFVQERLTIYIKKGMPDSLYKETLFHELMHALWFLSGANSINIANAEDNEEMTISVVTPWLMQMLKQNPNLANLYND